MKAFPEEALCAAVYLFEKCAGRSLSQSELDEIVHHGLSEHDAGSVVNSIMESISLEGCSTAYRSLAYFALGKRGDSALLSFLRSRLSIELKRDIDLVYQVMIALDNLGEEVFSRSRESYSVVDYDLNRADAVSYLSGINLVD